LTRWLVDGRSPELSYYSTGNPFTVHGRSRHLRINWFEFPDWNPGVNWKPAHQTIQNWYNAGAFLRPADGTFGNVRRNSLYGPGLKVFNLSAAKSVSIPGREGMSVEFRADAQNVFNHASFGFPSNSLGGSSGAGTAYTNTKPHQYDIGPGPQPANWHCA